MVPTQTEFAHALAQPYSVIHSIINRREVNPQSPSEPTDADVVYHFRELFSDQDRTSKTEARLVRWRCMIQDTGFATEVYQSYQLEDLSSVPQASSSSSQTTATPSALYSAFGLDFSLSANTSASEADAAGAVAGGTASSEGGGIGSSSNKARAQRRKENESLRERNVMYAVSVPGETAWARRAFGDANVPDEDGLSSGLDAPSLGNNVASSGTSSSPNPFKHKTPTPEESHVGGLLKLYDVDGASSSLQVTQVIASAFSRAHPSAPMTGKTSASQCLRAATHQLQPQPHRQPITDHACMYSSSRPCRLRLSRRL
ncbi:hypothetical protein CF326_g9269 [Tilletia indica]|nr:hypothetical protein CF326_g9269 [Tilletia indica]